MTNTECFLLAAKDLQMHPKDCIVFEDSFAGIEAGNRAGMIAVGLSTTNSSELLKDRCIKVISDFELFTVNDLLSIYDGGNQQRNMTLWFQYRN